MTHSVTGTVRILLAAAGLLAAALSAVAQTPSADETRRQLEAEKAVKEDIPENVSRDLKIRLVSSIEDVLEAALLPGEPTQVHDRDRWQLRLSN